MKKPIKPQPRTYLLNPVMRDAAPAPGETHWGQPTAAVHRRYETYREALMTNIERRRARMIRRGRGDLTRLDLDYTHSLQMLDYYEKQASRPRKLALAAQVGARRVMWRRVMRVACAFLGHRWMFFFDQKIVVCAHCRRVEPMPYGDRRLPYL